MKKLMFLSLAIFVLCSCGPKQEKAKKLTEEGVEVIINPKEPCKIKGEFSTLHLEKEFTIDTENEKIAEMGLYDI